jgi:mRNA-degrading endonuclease YafQ of YafQ-DinJ toxin-antitoxin module
MRTIKYTSRFRRDYRREKSASHGRKLDVLLKAVVDKLAEDTPCRAAIWIIRFPANGATIATATSGRI